MAGQAVRTESDATDAKERTLPQSVIDAIAAGKGVVMADGLGGYACAETEDECYRIVRDRNGEE